MDLAKIIGTVVATKKAPLLVGSVLNIIEPLDENLKPAGEPLIATDSRAKYGNGEIVYYVASGDAEPTGPDGKRIPVDAAIIGIVDEVTLKKISEGKK